MCIVAGLTLADFAANHNLFGRHFFARYSSEHTELVLLLHFGGCSTGYSGRLHVFLSPSLDILRMTYASSIFGFE